MKVVSKGKVKFIEYDDARFMRFTDDDFVVWYTVTDTGYESVPDDEATMLENVYQLRIKGNLK